MPSAAQPAYAVGEATTPAPEEEEAYAQEQPPAPPPTVEPSREASAARAEGSSPGEPDTSPAVPPRESATPYQPEIAPAGDRSRSIGTSAAAAAALAAATARYRAAQAAARPVDSMPVAAGSFDRPASTLPVQPAAQTGGSDDLTRIRGIDAEMRQKLNALGVSRFAEIAAWRREDVRRISEALGFRGRIEQENWIEQAQILATGTETAFSRNRSGAGPLARPSPDQGERKPPSAPTPQVVTASAASSATSVTPPKKPSGLGRDNLQRIRRITEDIERVLNGQGIFRYDQIARWSASDVARFDLLLGKKGRISSENWIEQAALLAGGGETAYARDFSRHQASAPPPRLRPAHLLDAIREAQASGGTAQVEQSADESSPPPQKIDLSSLRSVRSEAFLPAKPEPAGATGTKMLTPKRPDDLKRIRGIGVPLEKRLNSLGCWTYEQIANWTAEDVDRMSRALEISGRIERENWIEQARILASGGKTEFARRRDRGEAAVNRPAE